MIDRRRSVKTDLGQTSDCCAEGGSRRVSASGHRRAAHSQHCHAAAAAIFVGVVGMLGMARAYEAPTFVDYRENGTYSPCELAGGCQAIANVETTAKYPSLLPFVNPPDGHVFYGRIGDDIDFYVAGQQGGGVMAKTLSILFEEDASLMSGGAFEYTKPTAGQTASVIDNAHFRVYDDAKPVYASYNPITRYYSLTVKKFVPSKYLTMCFRILMDCPFPWLPCPAEDPAAPCGVGVALSTCANCCFKTPAQPPPPPSALWEGMEAGPDGNSDASTSPERSCYLDKEGRCLNSRFYPRRCVRMYVAEAPQIVSVLPVDHSMVLGAVAVKQHAKDWLRNSTAANVHVKTGQILRLNIDAMDPNEEDDIDIRPDAGVSLPAGAALGARMCCNSEYEQCKELPFASKSCSRVCTWHCGSEYPTHHTNTTLESACVEECADHCVRNTCRFVRRQLRMQPTPELIAQHPGAFTGLKFVAFDDSGRLASRKVGVCCAAADLQSQWEFVGTPLAAGVSVTATATMGAFVDPMPQGITQLPDAYVNCPMPAFQVHAFTAQAKNLFIIPDGCAIVRAADGITPIMPPTLSEGCKTTGYCDMCYPNFPKGMQVLGQARHLWASTNFSSSIHAYRTASLLPHYIAGAAYTIERNSASQTLLHVTVRANALPPPGGFIVIRGVRPTTSAIYPSTGVAACTLAMGGGGYGSWVVATEWNSMELHLKVVWPSGADIPQMDPTQRLMVACEFAGRDVQMSNDASVAFESPERIVTEGVYIAVNTSRAPFSAQSNSTASMYGGGQNSNGLGGSRAVRWTPSKGQEGQEYQLCFTAVAWSNISNVNNDIRNAPRRCFAVRVVRCKYCTLEGDTFESLATRFHTSWLQLWGANSAQGLSFSSLDTGTLLTLGVEHVLPKDMMISGLALQFATTARAVRELNPDLPMDGEWVGEGRHVCIVAGVCDSSVALDGSGSHNYAHMSSSPDTTA